MDAFCVEAFVQDVHCTRLKIESAPGVKSSFFINYKATKDSASGAKDFAS